MIAVSCKFIFLKNGGRRHGGSYERIIDFFYILILCVGTRLVMTNTPPILIDSNIDHVIAYDVEVEYFVP